MPGTSHSSVVHKRGTRDCLFAVYNKLFVNGLNGIILLINLNIPLLSDLSCLIGTFAQKTK